MVSPQFFVEDAATYACDQLFASDALLLGRVTYQGSAATWSSRAADEFADRMNGLPKYVVSTTLKEAELNNSTPIRDNAAQEVSKLKRQPGTDMLIYGGGELVRTLMRHDLMDEYRVWVHPIVVGSGKRRFGKESETKVLSLVHSTTFGSGTVVLCYRPDEKEAEE